MAEKLQVPFYEISVKTKENVEIALTHLVEDVKKKFLDYEPSSSQIIAERKEREKNECCCQLI